MSFNLFGEVDLWDIEEPDHPAKFTLEILYVVANHPVWFREDTRTIYRILDPFAGVGRIHLLPTYWGMPDGEGIRTIGIELEPEWARTRPGTLVGNALNLPFKAGSIDAIVTSPTYGNRMADTYDGRDGSSRHTYRISLGRIPSRDSSAVMQWGVQYRHFHYRVIAEMWEVLSPGGLLFLNMCDHIRDHKVMPVVQWWWDALETLGFTMLDKVSIQTPHLKHGANSEARVENETIILARKDIEIA